jgi:hypothetical protein
VNIMCDSRASFLCVFNRTAMGLNKPTTTNVKCQENLSCKPECDVEGFFGGGGRRGDLCTNAEPSLIESRGQCVFGIVTKTIIAGL